MTNAHSAVSRFPLARFAFLLLGVFLAGSVFLAGAGRRARPAAAAFAQGSCSNFSVTPRNGPLPQATVGVPYGQALTPAGGTPPYVFLGTGGTFPPGISMSARGAISGTPLAPGSFTFNVRVTDGSPGVEPCTINTSYSITVVRNPNCTQDVVIAPTSLPGAKVGVDYSQKLTATGGTAPFTFRLASGELPVGFDLSGTGELTGKAVAPGTATFQVTATDASGNNCAGAKDYTLTITEVTNNDDNTPPTVRVVSPGDGESIPSGSKFTIVWTAQDNVGVDRQTVAFSDDDGLSFNTVIASNLDGAVRDFLWEVPAGLRVTRGRIRVEATDAAGNKGGATSGRIAITGQGDVLPPSVSILSPNSTNPDQAIFPNDGFAKDNPAAKDPIKIQWTAEDDTGIESFDISATTRPLSGDTNEFPIIVATGVAGDKRTFDWTPGPNFVSETVSLRITARDAAGNTGTSINRTPFAVRARPVIKFFEYFCAEQRIFGDNFNPRSLVTLNDKPLSPFRGFVKFGPSPEPIKGSQLLVIERKSKIGPGENKKGKFDDSKGAENTLFVNTDGLFSKVFTVIGDGSKPPRVQITSPARDAKFKPGDTINITWEASDKCKVDAQQITFIPGNRGFDDECGSVGQQLLVANLDGRARSFTWVVPQTFIDFGRLRIRSTSIEGVGQDIVGTGNPNNTGTPKIEITEPKNSVTAGKEAKITWTFSGPCNPAEFIVDFTGRFNGQIARVPGNTLTTAWQVPAELTGDATIRVRAGNTLGTSTVTVMPGGGPGGGPQVQVRLALANGTVLFPRPNLAFNSDRVQLTWTPDQRATVTTYEIAYSGDGSEAGFRTIDTVPGTTTSLQISLNARTDIFRKTGFENPGAFRVTAQDNQGRYNGTLTGVTIQDFAVSILSPLTNAQISRTDPLRIQVGQVRPTEVQLRVFFLTDTGREIEITRTPIAAGTRDFTVTLTNDVPTGAGTLIVRASNGSQTGEDRVRVFVR